MHSKNMPTLFDNYNNMIQKSNTGAFKHNDTLADMRAHLADTQRYVFDEDASHLMGALVRDAAPLILAQHEFARAPYPNTWIEIDIIAYLEALDGRDARSDKTADSRVGYLITKEHILFFVSETPTHKPVFTPYWYILHEPMSFEQELALAQKLDLSRMTLRQHLLGNSGLSDDWFRSDAANDFCRSHRFMLGKSLENTPARELRKILVGAAGSLKQAITALLLLARPGSGVVNLQNQARRQGLIKGKTHVLAPHHKVTLHLSRPKALQKMVNNMQTGQHHRYHSVRGHWAQTRLGMHCEHDWEPVDPDHYECLRPGCKAKRWWKKNHHRGDISLGSVTKDYEVTK